MSALIKDKVKNEQLQMNFKLKRDSTKKAPSQAQLIQYVPNKSEKSEILNDHQISALVAELPTMIKMCDWRLVYSLNRDGISMLTFFEKCKRSSTTLLVVQD